MYVRIYFSVRMDIKKKEKKSRHQCKVCMQLESILNKECNLDDPSVKMLHLKITIRPVGRNYLVSNSN